MRFNSNSLAFLGILILLITLPGFSLPGEAQERGPTKVYLFWAEGCPHCLVEKQFLEKLKQRDQNLSVVSLELTKSKETREIFQEVGRILGVEVAGVPFTVVGNQYVVGWHDDATSGLALEKAIKKVREDNLPDIVAVLMPPPGPSPDLSEKRPIPDKLTFPIIGEIELKYLSLGLLTVIMGALDGFNPCAMWVLVFLISLLLGMEDRKKMWLLGSLFIFSSGFVYFLFMAAWLNLFMFIGLIVWVKIAIGLVALGAGAYNLKEYLTNRLGTCKLTLGERRQRTLERIKNTVQNQSWWLAVGGIICLAFALNLVELLCSLGLPVIYTEILTLSALPVWQYYLYLVLYIFIFILDDMIVFGVAMLTLSLVGGTTRYKHWSNLIGGIIMLIIGVLLIFKPEVLMFS
jgi:thiol-disulfide isomerase/thioredoxin